MTALHPILVAVALVLQMKAGEPIGTATGFFLQLAEDKFFVTNKHVVDPPEPDKPKPDALRLRLHLDRNDVRKNDWLDLPLFTHDGKRRWKEHPRGNVDVALVPLRDTDLSRFSVHWLTSSDYLPSDFVLHPGEDVFIIGYPRGFYDSVHNLPIFRDAMIASAYGVPFQDNPFFLTDAKLHPGVSGSPVFTKPKNTWTTTKGSTRMIAGTHYFLLGVHSGTVALPGSKTPNPLALGATWYAHLFEEIANSK